MGIKSNVIFTIVLLGVFLMAHEAPPPYPQKYLHAHGFLSNVSGHPHLKAHAHNIGHGDHIHLQISEAMIFSLNPPHVATETVSSTRFIAIPIDATSFQLTRESTIKGWDVTDLTLIATENSRLVLQIDYAGSTVQDLWVRPDGKEIFILLDINLSFNPTLDPWQIIGYTLTTPFDLTTIQYDGNALGIHFQPDDRSEDGGEGFNNFGRFAFTPDGLTMFVYGSWLGANGHDQNLIRAYSLSPAFNLASATPSGDEYITDPFNAPLTNTFNNVDSMTFKADGTRLYATVSRAWDGSVDDNDGIMQWNLASPYSLAAATFPSDWLKNTSITPRIDFRPDGKRLFRQFGQSITQYNVDPAWDVSTATTLQATRDLGVNVLSFRFSSDGLWLYVLDSAVIRQYSVGGSSSFSSNITGLPVFKEGGNVRKTFTEVSGLEDFEGVCLGIGSMGVVANGDVVNQLCATTNPNCVTDGKITLCNRASRLHIGWRYISDIETLDIESQQGTMQGKIKRIPSVTIRFKKSRLGLVGPDRFHLTKMKQRDQEAMGTPTTLLTGDKQVKLEPVWNSNGRIFYRQLDPLPVTILAIIPDLNLEDGPDD